MTVREHGSTELAKLRWRQQNFAELEGGELYEILALRQRVFVVEQECAYLDADGGDRDALHFTGWTSSGRLIACARLMGPGSRFTEPSVGRLAVAAGFRRLGAASHLLEQALSASRRLYPGRPVRISAQSYLEAFYRRYGFAPAGAPYAEDGIDHIDMILPPGPC